MDFGSIGSMDVDIRKWQYRQRGLDLSLRLAVAKVAMDIRAKNPRIFMILVDFVTAFLENLPLSRRVKTEMDKIVITA